MTEHVARFYGPLDIRKIGDQRWMVLDDLLFFSVKYAGVFVVPRGFQTDLASIPQAAQAVVSKVGKWDRAAVLHDAAYSNALMTQDEQRIRAVKEVADYLFWESMRADGVGRWQAFWMWRVIHRFGNPRTHPLSMNA
jgi:hypothetical protein